ncbi:hypothetical protein Dimus_015791 [Dionaea muscipula]
MAEDAEKRFHNVMDKVFNGAKSNPSPTSTSSSSSDKAARGQKRPFSFLESKSRREKGDAARNVSAEESSCRPWERGDLIRRLATFKSMTWFARPKVIDPVSCAKRGWVNVDMDTIACEVCGARLLFSTPSSWSREQVEKAALVFSLKLDNGHRLLCPWVNNACDESLALFPPTPAPVLVHHYKQRYSALLHLSALPKVSASAIKMMQIPQLEHFLQQFAEESGLAPHGSSSTGYLGNNSNLVSGNLYYQAHRLLSLCGWEPRVLPYIVDCKDQPRQPSYSPKDGFPPTLSHVPAGDQCTTVTVYHSGSGDTVQADEDPVLSGFHYDPSSTVLECKLCGATIGLWMFSTIPQPIELLRVVGYPETSADNSNNVSSSTEETTPEKGTSPNLSLTIAGGPLPTNQNFRARISLPVIGRNLRARLAMQSLKEGNVGEMRGKPYFNTSNSVTGGSTGSTEYVEGDGSDHGQIPDLVEHAEKFNQGTTEVAVEICNSMSSGPNHDTGIIDKQVVGADDQIIPTMSSIPNMLDAPNVAQNANGVQRIEQTPFGRNAVTSHTNTGLERRSFDKEMEFHPIKQHRYFCPWVTSTDSIAPGWQQTLLALQKEKVFSVVPDIKDSPPATSLIKVDDPIKSIRKLFKSPAKRINSTHLSN